RLIHEARLQGHRLRKAARPRPPPDQDRARIQERNETALHVQLHALQEGRKESSHPHGGHARQGKLHGQALLDPRVDHTRRRDDERFLPAPSLFAPPEPPSSCISLSSFLSTLPVALRGSSLRNSTSRGTL